MIHAQGSKYLGASAGCRERPGGGRYRVNVQLVTAGQELAECEELLLAFRAALAADTTRLHAVYSDRLVRIRLEDQTFELWPTKDAARPLWNCELTLKCEFEPSS